jgi:Flp pilus assembly protein TadD
VLKVTGCLALLWLPSLSAQSYKRSALVTIDPSPVHQASARTIPAELLRYPLSDKARHMLQKVLQTSNAGDHAGAVKELQKTLAKWPGTAPYVYSLLGVEYLKTGQIPEAVQVLERAVALLPHDASNHANLGLALVCQRQYDRAEPELRRALDLDPRNSVAGKLLSVLALNNTAQK